MLHLPSRSLFGIRSVELLVDLVVEGVDLLGVESRVGL
jgi:hypothetical protein